MNTFVKGSAQEEPRLVAHLRERHGVAIRPSKTEALRARDVHAALHVTAIDPDDTDHDLEQEARA